MRRGVALALPRPGIGIPARALVPTGRIALAMVARFPRFAVSLPAVSSLALFRAWLIATAFPRFAVVECTSCAKRSLSLYASLVTFTLRVSSVVRRTAHLLVIIECQVARIAVLAVPVGRPLGGVEFAGRVWI